MLALDIMFDCLFAVSMCVCFVSWGGGGGGFVRVVACCCCWVVLFFLLFFFASLFVLEIVCVILQMITPVEYMKTHVLNWKITGIRDESH